jgi:hypothetical protein
VSGNLLHVPTTSRIKFGLSCGSYSCYCAEVNKSILHQIQSITSTLSDSDNLKVSRHYLI